MQEDDGDIEEWAQQLRGKVPAGDTPAETSALRSAIAASNRSERDALASDRVAHARLIKRLEKEGLLSDAPAEPPAPAASTDTPAESRSIRRLGEPGLLSSDAPHPDTPHAIETRPRWHAWVGAMAAVLLVAIGLRFALLSNPNARGFAGSVSLLSEQPAVTLAEAASQLESLGLKPRRVTEDGRAFLELDVSQEQLATFFEWAQPRGGRPVVVGSYRIFVDSEPNASR